MRRLSSLPTVCGLAGALLTTACGGEPSPGATGATDGTGGGGGAGGIGTGGSEGFLPFLPSNVSADHPTGAAKVRFSTSCGDQGRINTNDETISDCAEVEGDLVFQRIELEDATELDLIVVETFTIDLGVEVHAFGSRPLAVIASDEIRINGALNGQGYTIGLDDFPGPGAAVAGSIDGLGMGAGEGSETQASGGASHCGLGGKGADGPTAGGGPGPGYGNSEVVPLLGGSSGGTSCGAAFGGYGGGAIQLTAGARVVVGPGGSINVGGRAGENCASGAGSGGSLLLEANEVEVDGVIAANGGAGAATWSTGSQDGLTSDQPAQSSYDDKTMCPLGGLYDVKGGAGSAGDEPNGRSGEVYTGTDLTCTLGRGGGGGGGGAGRIRINSKTGVATITGVLSPSAATSCATEGKVTPLP